MEEEQRHASPEGMRSEKDAVSMVKHGENEKSATKATKKHSTFYFSDFRFSFSLCFHSSIFSRPDTLPCVFCNRSYRVMFVFLLDTPLS